MRFLNGKCKKIANEILKKQLEQVDEIKRNLLDEFVENIYVKEEKNIIIEFKFKNEFEDIINFLKSEQKLLV